MRGHIVLCIVSLLMESCRESCIGNSEIGEFRGNVTLVRLYDADL